jgi:hypothetical protein
MSRTSRREYLLAIWGRYQRVGRKFRSQILDEFCQVCGYRRKYAIRLLGGDPHRRRACKGPRPRYGAAGLAVLKRIWLKRDRLCSKGLKAALPTWLPHYERRYGALAEDLRRQVLAISPATIDRRLRPVRVRYRRRGLGGTRPNQLLPHWVPIRTDHADVTGPGFWEADTVAHCGPTLAGSFVWSLTFTDIFSQWTENRAVWNKGATEVVQQVQAIEAQRPFALLGLDVDNGSEFLNHHLWRYWARRPEPIHFSRSRPYKKNDQAHLEQKNWTHVRPLLGYDRIERRQLIPLLNDLYQTWSRYHNYFCPNRKLRKKTRRGSRLRKTYYPPRTPYAVLLDCPQISQDQKTRLRQTFPSLDPFALKAELESKLRNLFHQLRTGNPISESTPT